ncbi:predicted protein [Sclerotinia sclerotiorum 1980 UF-70]|uniref:Uncharacterized protein n=1 Tax=Sclerotinia sclerotiorum (strain ATCC 18683 / 1980 / Ss-1) TaxID=665079 RepID=A7EKJ9_SCLS1|nr:predicted protein [Sclerotinia sclerotiorum 1980 UF-70]EDO03365.1 predicted protein [Sclerotinia sclerotiorum 1980 UF-70]
MSSTCNSAVAEVAISYFGTLPTFQYELIRISSMNPSLNWHHANAPTMHPRCAKLKLKNSKQQDPIHSSDSHYLPVLYRDLFRRVGIRLIFVTTSGS